MSQVNYYPPAISGIITLARNSPQNPQDKRLTGQNLDGKGLMGRFLAGSVFVVLAECAACAGTRMERSGGCAQGQMSHEGWISLKKMGAVPSVPGFPVCPRISRGAY